MKITRASNCVHMHVCQYLCVVYKSVPNQMGSCDSTIPYYSHLGNCSPQKTRKKENTNLINSKENPLCDDNMIIKDFIGEILCQFFS